MASGEAVRGQFTFKFSTGGGGGGQHRLPRAGQRPGVLEAWDGDGDGQAVRRKEKCRWPKKLMSDVTTTMAPCAMITGIRATSTHRGSKAALTASAAR